MITPLRRLALAVLLLAALAAVPRPALAADVTISSDFRQDSLRQERALVFTTSSIGYAVFVELDFDLKLTKTTDGGATWGSVTTIKTGTIASHRRLVRPVDAGRHGDADPSLVHQHRGPQGPLPHAWIRTATPSAPSARSSRA